MRPHPPLLTVPGAQHVPSYVAAIVERLLEKSPADRYRSAEVVADLLERALAKYEHDLLEKGLSPQPLSKLAEIPRRPLPKEEEDDAAATPSSSTSTSPFVSISLPPEEVERRRGSLRRSGPRARSLAYASTEKMAVGAYTLPARVTAKAGSTAKTSSQEEGRVAMLPFIMGAEEEVADEDIEEVTDEATDDEPVAEPARAEWSFESVARLDRAPVSQGPVSSEERMFDLEGAAPRADGQDTFAPHAASFAGERARPTMAMRVPPQRSTLASVAVVLVVAASVAVVGLVMLSVVSGGQLRRAAEQQGGAAQPVADAGAPDASADAAPRPAPSGHR
jgi:hypothetical protein